MLETIKEADKQLFLFLNSHHSDFFDSFFYIVTSRFTWIPLYILLFYIVYKAFKNKTWIIVLRVALLIIITDQLTNLIKNSVHRLRPCHNPTLTNYIHLVNGDCGGQFGFVSAHAANSMAITVFLLLLFVNRIKWLPIVLVIYTLLVSYSRIYLGMHYPIDTIGGWILGGAIGYILFKLYNKSFIENQNISSDTNSEKNPEK